MANNNEQKKVTVKKVTDTTDKVANLVQKADNVQKKANSTLTKVIIALILIIALIVGGIVGGIAIQQHREEEVAERVDNVSISQKVVGLSQLTTAQLTYHGLVEFSEGKVRFINKKEFLMTYTAKVTAGIDFSQAEVTESINKVTIKLPAAKIQTVSIDPNSIQFYDLKKALFNQASKEDAVEAQKEADADVRSSMDKKELLETATEQAKSMITEMVTPFLADGMTLIIE